MLNHKILCLVIVGLWLSTWDAIAGGLVARQQAMREMQQMQQMPPEMRQQQLAMTLEAQKTTHEQLLQKQEDLGGGDSVISSQELWEMLAVSSEVWGHLVDRQMKALIVETYIDWYRQQGIIIAKSQVDYMLLIDSIALQNPGLLRAPFQHVLMFVAVMEYDFDNGMDRDQLAFQILGPQLYEANRKRFMGQ